MALSFIGNLCTGCSFCNKTLLLSVLKLVAVIGTIVSEFSVDNSVTLRHFSHYFHQLLFHSFQIFVSINQCYVSHSICCKNNSWYSYQKCVLFQSRYNIAHFVPKTLVCNLDLFILNIATEGVVLSYRIHKPFYFCCLFVKNYLKVH